MPQQPPLYAHEALVVMRRSCKPEMRMQTSLWAPSMPYSNPEKHRERTRQRTKERRDLWFKENGPCKICGSWDRLELDHEDPRSKMTHRIWGMCNIKRNSELKKCRPLCYKCHKKKTVIENSSRTLHGTKHAYDKYGCRCQLCSKAKSDSQRKQRDRYRLVSWTPRPKMISSAIQLPCDFTGIVR